MDFQKYGDAEAFSSDVLGILLENEVQNNLLISILTDSKARYASDWLMATVADYSGIVLTALCTKPFNLLLYESGRASTDAMDLLAREIRRLGAGLPGVLAERSLARRFADAYLPGCPIEPRMSMIVMRLDSLAEHKVAPGSCRTLQERDMFFVPFWERSFSEDSKVQVFSIKDNVDRIRTRLGKNSHFIWEDGIPVSQAVNGRCTPNGAVINMVYTPPHYRGRGYATSVVAELAGSLLKRGHSFCCLFADAENPVSRELYRKLGFYDVYTFDDIRF